ncbi:MAG: SDR family oxidoreductase [Brevibacillus sp.]|nr:SDR family oxidoreductase [Brevibacillus sp.]
MDLGLAGKVAFVSASSKGLGKAAALEMAREGAHVMISSRSEEELERTKAEIEGLAAGKVAYVVCDITRPEQIKRAVGETVKTFGTVDILVNNGGGPAAGGFDRFSDEDWYRAFDLTLLSYIRFIREVLPHMRRRKWGRIINFASSSVKQPIPELVLSNTLRAGVVGLSKSLADELAGEGILVHTVAPGRIATERVYSLDKHQAERLGVPVEQVKAKEEQSIPLGRYGETAEFGKVVAFLASPACSYMTGTTILVDGGLVRSI